MNDQLEKQISALDDVGLNRVEAVIKDLRKARIEARNKALPEFTVVQNRFLESEIGESALL